MIHLCVDEISHLNTTQVKWLISLYDWALFTPIPDAYVISSRLQHIEYLGILGLVEVYPSPTTGDNRLVRITEHGKQYLVDVYLVETALTFIGIIKQQPKRHTLKDSPKIEALIKQSTLKVSPLLLTHKDADIREIGKRIVDRFN